MGFGDRDDVVEIECARVFHSAPLSQEPLGDFLGLLRLFIGEAPRQHNRGIEDKTAHGLLSCSRSLIVEPPSDSPWRLPKLASRRAIVAMDSASGAGLGRRRRSISSAWSSASSVVSARPELMASRSNCSCSGRRMIVIGIAFLFIVVCPAVYRRLPLEVTRLCESLPGTCRPPPSGASNS